MKPKKERLDGYRASIERLCQALRELRRDNPEHFFDTPYERLYRSLESALDSFYRSKKDGPAPGREEDPSRPV